MSAVSLREIRKALRSEADSEQAAQLARFFKTGKGQYGEGDVFLGIKVPAQRRIAGTFAGLGEDGIRALLNSKIHEERMTALLITARRYDRGGDVERKRLFELYLSMTARVNSWDLVDLSAPNIVGRYLLNRDRAVLGKLAGSENVWERRIAIVSTLAFIRNGDCGTTFEIAGALLRDPHDLIHKAVGWMLREAGKKDIAAERAFLDAHRRAMPRTMLRYAIERFPDDLRGAYLRKDV